MRHLTPYEFNQCQKYGIDPSKITDEKIPIEYITGQIEFYGYPYTINQNVLIPRLESEKIIDIALSLKPKTVADIGTGSGCLGLSLYLKNPTIDIYLSDISPKALSIAQINAHKLISPPFSNPHFLQSNLLSQYPSIKFDLIIANLPYIPSSNIIKLDPSVRNYEPKLALDGGPDGLDLINQLLLQAPTYLNKDGYILLEIDDTHTPNQFSHLIKTYSLEFIPDCFNKIRFLKLKLNP